MAKRSLEDRLLSADAERRKAEKKAAKDDFVRRHAAALEALPVEFRELRARLKPGDGTLMKSQRVIDHLLFRKLFAETFANGTRDYVIESSGVRWHQSEEALLAAESLEEEHEIIFRIENIIRPARLSFPCSTDQALVWAMNNMDSAPPGGNPNGFLYIPDWLIGALKQDDTDSALAILADAGLRVCADLTEAQSEGDHAAQKLDLAEIRNLKLAIESFGEIGTLAIKNANATKHQRAVAGRQSIGSNNLEIGNKSGAIGNEILVAAQRAGDPWPTASVWQELERMTIKGTGTCLVEVHGASEGFPARITYIDAKGKEREITPKMLGERLVQLRKKLRKTDANA